MKIFINKLQKKTSAPNIFVANSPHIKKIRNFALRCSKTAFWSIWNIF